MDVRVWTEFIWLRTVSSAGILRTDLRLRLRGHWDQRYTE